MFKLYVTEPPKMIDTNENQDKLLTIMGRMLKTNPEERFLLVEREGNTDKWFKGIWGIEEYNKYLEELENKRLINRSCVDLKRDIVDLADVKVHKLTRKK